MWLGFQKKADLYFGLTLSSNKIFEKLHRLLLLSFSSIIPFLDKAFLQKAQIEVSKYKMLSEKNYQSLKIWIFHLQISCLGISVFRYYSSYNCFSKMFLNEPAIYKTLFQALWEFTVNQNPNFLFHSESPTDLTMKLFTLRIHWTHPFHSFFRFPFPSTSRHHLYDTVFAVSP